MAKVLNLRNRSEGEIWDFVAQRIDRLTMWGNPYVIGIDGDRVAVLAKYEYWLFQWVTYKKEIVIARKYSNKWVIENLKQLKDRDLACWCSPELCHGDILLQLAADVGKYEKVM